MGSQTPAKREAYARLALDQLPRLLGNLDRDPFSPTYGCFHRDYWLEKTSDFPDAVRQFSVHALALVYKHEMPGNVYEGNTRIRDWAVAALDFWASIQHKDGSFDEFYPYERGWVGPSAFTAYTSAEAFALLRDEMAPDVVARITAALRKTAQFIGAGESEEDHLGNHHAMACLAVHTVARVLGEEAAFEPAYQRLWSGFLTYYDADEGWCREYDGPDPGYLSAVVSFLGKIYAHRPDPELNEVMQGAARTCAHFLYPDGGYAGTLGSRNTVHFYPHGFELMAASNPLAAAVAERALASIDRGGMVPPPVMSDRYVHYRVPEYLLAYLDYGVRPDTLPPLPSESDGQRMVLARAGVASRTEGRVYAVANLAKGGPVKVFDRAEGRSLLNDAGLIGKLSGGKAFTTQWIDPDNRVSIKDDKWSVEGTAGYVPSAKVFTPLKGLIFRAVMVAVGWHPGLSHLIKGQIRKTLILARKRAPVRFARAIEFEGDTVTVSDTVTLDAGALVQSLRIGGEFHVRYVPQSRYFQPHELSDGARYLTDSELARLNSDRRLTVERVVSP
jgi:hypothetical protein